MGYDRGDSFPFNFEPNGILFGSKSKEKLCQHDHIPFNVKRNRNIVFSEWRRSFAPDFLADLSFFFGGLTHTYTILMLSNEFQPDIRFI